MPDTPLTPLEEVSVICERRLESQKYTADLWEELQEVYRGIKCRTAKKERKVPGTNKTEEDLSATNVAMPDLNIMWRNNVARLTGQPYRLRYIGGTQPWVAESASALAAQQYDRSREAWHDRRIVMFGEGLGFAYGKLYWDELGYDLKLRRAIVRNGQVTFRDRASIMQAMGAPDDEIRGAVQQLGPEVSDAEAADFMGKAGNDITITQRVKRYEGPCVTAPFPGDIYLSPGCLSMFDSDYVIESFQETDLWLQKQVKTLQYKDPDTGEMVPAFDEKAVQELIDLDPEPDISKINLKLMFEEAVGKSIRPLSKRLRTRKRYDMLRQDALDENGVMWITWVAEKYKDKPLGKMPYPWDLYGQYAYSEYVPLPDMISCYGDATPRLLRYLYQMHNRVVAQNFDYISNLLKKFLLIKENERIQEPVDRGFFREIRCEHLTEDAIKFLQEPPLPPGSFEREAQIVRMMQMAEPSYGGVNAGMQSNPQAGKTATTAIIQSKSNDILITFKVDGRNLYLRELGQKKLWMNQQAQDGDEPWEIDSKFWNAELQKQVDEGAVPKNALSERNGKTVAIRLDPLEIQEDLQVEPESGSYLAVDDDLRRQSAMDLDQVALAAPDVLDRRKVARFHLTTIRGIGDPDDFIIPENPNPNPLASAKVNVNISIPIPFESLPAAAKAELLAKANLETAPQALQDFKADDVLAGVEKLGKAATAAADMQEPPVPPEQQQNPQKPGKSKPKVKAAKA